MCGIKLSAMTQCLPLNSSIASYKQLPVVTSLRTFFMVSVIYKKKFPFNPTKEKKKLCSQF